MRLLGRRRRKTAVLLAMASGERSSVWGVGGGRRVDGKGVGGFVFAMVIPLQWEANRGWLRCSLMGLLMIQMRKRRVVISQGGAGFDD